MTIGGMITGVTTGGMITGIVGGTSTGMPTAGMITSPSGTNIEMPMKEMVSSPSGNNLVLPSSRGMPQETGNSSRPMGVSNIILAPLIIVPATRHRLNLPIPPPVRQAMVGNIILALLIIVPATRHRLNLPVLPPARQATPIIPLSRRQFRLALNPALSLRAPRLMGEFKLLTISNRMAGRQELTGE